MKPQNRAPNNEKLHDQSMSERKSFRMPNI